MLRSHQPVPDLPVLRIRYQHQRQAPHTARLRRHTTVILDDALVFSDDRRMGRIFDILNMAARNIQVIVLTCREQLFEGLGGRQLSLEPAGSEELASA